MVRKTIDRFPTELTEDLTTFSEWGESGKLLHNFFIAGQHICPVPAPQPKPTILVAEDDPKISSIVVMYLERAGFSAIATDNGLTALGIARQSSPAVVILDRMLPGLDGMSVCRILRDESRVPIIMLTARSAEPDKLEGLDSGADDYVVKPFSPRELIARVRAVLRRTSPSAPSTSIAVGEVHIDRDQHLVTVRGERIELTPTELKILTLLASAPGRVYTRAELLERIFGWDHEGTERGVDVHVKNLRRKIEADPQEPEIIETVFGAGYRLRKAKS